MCKLTLLALLGVSLALVLALLFRDRSEPTGVRSTAAPAGTGSEDPRLDGQGSPPSSEPSQPLPPDEGGVRVAVEVVDRRGNVVSGGQVSAVRVDGGESAPVQARSRGTLYVLRIPAEGPAVWGVSYVDRATGVSSGAHGLNLFALTAARNPAERRLRIVAFEMGSVLVEVVDELGKPFPGVPCRTSPVSAWEKDPHLTDGLGQTRISGVIGFVHVSAGPEGRPGAASPQLTVQPGEEVRVRLVLRRDSPVEDVPVYVDSGGNPQVSGQRVSVEVLSHAVGGARGWTVVDGDPVMLPIDRHGPISAIVREPTLGRMVFDWGSLAEAGSESELRIVIGVRHRVRLRFLGRDGLALPNLDIAYRRLGTGGARGEDNAGWIEFNPAGSSSAAPGGPWTTNEAGEVLTTPLQAGVYEVSTDRHRRTWDLQFQVPGDGNVRELLVDGVGVLAGRLEGPVSVAGQCVSIQARPWAELEGKRSEIALASGGQFWTTQVRPDGRWAMTIHLPPGSDLGCAATFPYTSTPFEMRRTLDLVHVQLGIRDVLLRSNAPGTWAVARIALRRGDVTALIGYAELRLASREGRSGLLVPLTWGKRTSAGPLAPGTYVVYYHEDVDLGPRVLGGQAASGGVRAVGLLELAQGEADYDVEIPE